MTLKSDAKFQETLTLGSKTDARNLVNLNAVSGMSENLHFDVLLLSKLYYVWVKKIRTKNIEYSCFDFLAYSMEPMFTFDEFWGSLCSLCSRIFGNSSPAINDTLSFGFLCLWCKHSFVWFLDWILFKYRNVSRLGTIMFNRFLSIFHKTCCC